MEDLQSRRTIGETVRERDGFAREREIRNENNGASEVTGHKQNLGNLIPEFNLLNFNDSLAWDFLIIASVLACVHSAHLESI